MNEMNNNMKRRRGRKSNAEKLNELIWKTREDRREELEAMKELGLANVDLEKWADEHALDLMRDAEIGDEPIYTPYGYYCCEKSYGLELDRVWEGKKRHLCYRAGEKSIWFWYTNVEAFAFDEEKVDESKIDYCTVTVEDLENDHPEIPEDLIENLTNPEIDTEADENEFETPEHLKEELEKFEKLVNKAVETEKDPFDALEANTVDIYTGEPLMPVEEPVEAVEKADYSTEEIAKLGSDDALEKWAEEKADEKCFNAQIYRSIGTRYGYYIVLPRSGDADDYEEKEYIHHFCGINGLGNEVWFCHNEADADMFYMDAYYKEMEGGR